MKYQCVFYPVNLSLGEDLGCVFVENEDPMFRSSNICSKKISYFAEVIDLEFFCPVGFWSFSIS